MSAIHTPGLLEAVSDGYRTLIRIQGEHGRRIASTFVQNQSRTPEGHKAQALQNEANARRLVAAWNACQGLSTEQVESIDGLLAKLAYQVMPWDRDELLAALQWREQFELRPGESHNDGFERVAEVFRRETGYLRPGKDCVIHSHEERSVAWHVWMEAGRARCRAAIAKATKHN